MHLYAFFSVYRREGGWIARIPRNATQPIGKSQLGMAVMPETASPAITRITRTIRPILVV
jgi:hypothetical protein